MTLYFITGNENKFREAKSFIPNLERFNLELSEIQSIDSQEIIKHKLLEAKEKHSGSFIVEDTSFYIDGMNGLPGPLIKWFEKTIGLESIANLTLLYGTKASAKCVLGIYNEKEIKFFEGIIKGKVVDPIGENGFGWDKIFIPDGYEKTFAEMTSDEKNGISMRRIAFEKLKDYLNK